MLTDEQISEIGKAARAVEGNLILPVTFARAIEAEVRKEIEAAVLAEREAITQMICKKADEWFKDGRVFGDSSSNDKGEVLRDLEDRIGARTQPMRIDDALESPI